jgi:hypothetical protein
MAAPDLIEAPLQRDYIQPAGEAISRGKVIDRIPWFQLIEEPQSFLDK